MEHDGTNTGFDNEQSYYGFTMRDLVPVVTRLSEKYTSKESSSISYEAAQELMEAVLYCIREFCQYTGKEAVLSSGRTDVWTAYNTGYSYVVEKTKRAKDIYDRIIVNFNDYGCENYRATIISGMPEFFLRYDAKFRPQDHLLTLDYPIMNYRSIINNNDNTEENRPIGIDLVYEYLTGVEQEKNFLALFPDSVIKDYFKRAFRDYEELYYDNLCMPILLNAIGCIMVDKQISSLAVTEADCTKISYVLRDLEPDQIEKKISGMLYFITNNTLKSEQANIYFSQTAGDISFRIYNALQHNTLEGIFGVIEC